MNKCVADILQGVEHRWLHQESERSRLDSNIEDQCQQWQEHQKLTLLKIPTINRGTTAFAFGSSSPIYRGSYPIFHTAGPLHNVEEEADEIPCRRYDNGS